MNDINDLISKLEDDLTPVKPMVSPVLRSVIWFFSGLFSVLFVASIAGFRMDLHQKLMETVFVGELVFILILSASAIYSSAWLSIPEGAGKKHVLYVPYIILFIALCILGNDFLSHGISLDNFVFHTCIIDAILMGMVPVLLMIWMMKQGAPTAPIMGATMNMIAAGGIGYMGLRLTCGSDDVGHMCVYHILPFIFVGLLLGLIARRLYHW